MPLVQKALRTLPPGKHFDSGRTGVPGLLLVVKPDGNRSFVARLTVAGKRIEQGVGGLRDTPLSVARERVLALRQQVRAGVDPRREKAKERAAAVTFGELADEVCTAREQANEGNAKHVA